MLIDNGDGFSALGNIVKTPTIAEINCDIILNASMLPFWDPYPKAPMHVKLAAEGITCI